LEGKNNHMRGYTGAETVKVDGFWKDGEGIVLAAGHASGLTLRLRHLLFAWHEASWFGADIEERIDERSKQTELPLSPLLAMDYLSSPDPVRLLRVEWTPRANVLMELAKLLSTALVKGWYGPDWSHWTPEARAWRLEMRRTALAELDCRRIDRCRR